MKVLVGVSVDNSEQNRDKIIAQVPSIAVQD